MSFPIICHKCGSRGELKELTPISCCAACGCEDIDLDDFEATLETQAVGEWDACPDCGVVGCSPDCPGPSGSTTCPSCGGGAAIRNGKVECDHCSSENNREAMIEATGKSIVANVRTKLHEIAAGVLTTNPSMTREAAYEVAQKTITRYPKVAGITDDAIAMLNEGYKAGLVEADAVQWFAPSEAGQSIAREEVGEVPA